MPDSYCEEERSIEYQPQPVGIKNIFICQEGVARIQRREIKIMGFVFYPFHRPSLSFRKTYPCAAVMEKIPLTNKFAFDSSE